MIARLKKMLTRHEGRKTKPYHCMKGKLTIGIGHNITDRGLPANIRAYLDTHDEITNDMIDSLLVSDIASALTDCHRLYPAFNSFSEARQCALIDFMFNVGPGRASAFKKMTRAINSGNWELASEELKGSLYWKQLGGDLPDTDDGKIERPEEIAKMIREG